jgi:hypothetical protein
MANGLPHEVRLAAFCLIRVRIVADRSLPGDVSVMGLLAARR